MPPEAAGYQQQVRIGAATVTLTVGEMMRMPEDRFTVEVIGGVPVLATPDEIDLNNAAEMAALLEATAQGDGTLVVDMSRTRFCDSAGLHVLVRAHSRAQALGGELLLVRPATPVRRVFAITGIDRLILHFSRLDEALAHAPVAPSASSGPALTGSEPSAAPSF